MNNNMMPKEYTIEIPAQAAEGSAILRLIDLPIMGPDGMLNAIAGIRNQRDSLIHASVRTSLKGTFPEPDMMLR